MFAREKRVWEFFALEYFVTRELRCPHVTRFQNSHRQAQYVLFGLFPSAWTSNDEPHHQVQEFTEFSSWGNQTT